MIIFKKVRWKNILSSGNAFIEVSLNSDHTTLFLGESGSGKSTFLDALSFVLFNKPFRSVNKNQLVNATNKKNLVVECEFSIGSKDYLVRRGIAPNIFEIFLNGELLNKDSHIKDYQDVLEKQILKFNFKSFSQIVVLGASNFVPFMQLRPADRRVIIENLLDIEIFSIMNSILKEKQSAIKDELSKVDNEISMIRYKMELHKEYLAEMSKDLDKKISENHSEIAINLEKISKLESAILEKKEDIKRLQSLIVSKKEVGEKLSKLNSILNSLTSKKTQANKISAFYSSNDSCPTCEQKIADDFRTKKLNEEATNIVELDNGLQQTNVHIQSCKEKLDDIVKIENDIFTLESKIQSMSSGIKSHISVINHLNSEIKKLENQKESKNNGSLTSQLDDEVSLQSQIDVLESKKSEILHSVEIQNFISQILKDGGVKTKIIKQYLPLIKKYTNNFLLSMNFYMDFSLDEEFNESISANGRENFSYSNFSEGEKQRIDLALLFTWRTIAKLKNSVNTNLLILDEVLDSFLGVSATENVLQMLKNDMLRGANIFVISHKETIADKFENVIRFEKKQGFSYIVEE